MCLPQPVSIADNNTYSRCMYILLLWDVDKTLAEIINHTNPPFSPFTHQQTFIHIDAGT